MCSVGVPPGPGLGTTGLGYGKEQPEYGGEARV